MSVDMNKMFFNFCQWPTRQGKCLSSIRGMILVCANLWLSIIGHSALSSPYKSQVEFNGKSYPVVQQKNGTLDVTLTCARTTLAAGEPLGFAVRATNQGHKTLLIQKNWITSVYFDFIDKHGKNIGALNSTSDHGVIYEYPRPHSINDYIALDPQYFYGEMLNIRRYQLAPGTYRVRAWLMIDDYASEFGFSSWYGDICSNYLTITINDK